MKKFIFTLLGWGILIWLLLAVIGHYRPDIEVSNKLDVMNRLNDLNIQIDEQLRKQELIDLKRFTVRHKKCTFKNYAGGNTSIEPGTVMVLLGWDKKYGKHVLIKRSDFNMERFDKKNIFRAMPDDVEQQAWNSPVSIHTTPFSGPRATSSLVPWRVQGGVIHEITLNLNFSALVIVFRPVLRGYEKFNVEKGDTIIFIVPDGAQYASEFVPGTNPPLISLTDSSAGKLGNLMAGIEKTPLSFDTVGTEYRAIWVPASDQVCSFTVCNPRGLLLIKRTPVTWKILHKKPRSS